MPNVTDIGLKPRSVKRVAVIGGGLMGSGIATALILGNIYVVLKEVNSEYLLRGIKMVEGKYSLSLHRIAAYLRTHVACHTVSWLKKIACSCYVVVYETYESNDVGIGYYYVLFLLRKLPSWLSFCLWGIV